MDFFSSRFGLEPGVMAIAIIFVIFVIWLLVRELRTWYWKIDDIIQLLRSIDRKLDDLKTIPIDGLEPDNPMKTKVIPEEDPHRDIKRELDRDLDGGIEAKPKKSIKELLNKKIF